uniref:Tetraspanin n=1 Tax=Mesocestoides corti TaxID=53468 RepID=A0A5K3FU78_MESCO
KGTIPTGSFVFIIVIGIVVVVIALLGFIGAWKRNKCMLLTFAILAGILFVIEFIAAVLTFVVQAQLKCCGGVSASDWKTVPASCCPSGKRSCKDPYPVGCAEATFDLIKGYFLASGIITILLCIVELTAVICACILAHQIKTYEKF